MDGEIGEKMKYSYITFLIFVFTLSCKSNSELVTNLDKNLIAYIEANPDAKSIKVSGLCSERSIKELKKLTKLESIVLSGSGKILKEVGREYLFLPYKTFQLNGK